MPRRRTRRGRGPSKSALVQRSLSMRVKQGGSNVLFGSIGISADFPLRVRKLTYQMVSNGTAAIQIVLYGNGSEVVAESRPYAISQATKSGSLACPLSTDFHLPANDEFVFSVRCLDAQTDATTVLLTVVVHLEYKSYSTLVSVSVKRDEDLN